LLLAACATVPGPEVADGLFNDRLFLAPSERISAEDVFALSEEMKRYVSVDIAAQLRSKGARQGLVEALRKSGELKLDYDSVMTRNAAQAFAARSGNCLSLVIMTAAFAKQLDLPVTYQSVLSSDTVSRSGNIQFFVGHVNLTLGERPKTLILSRSRDDVMTIDFLPPQEAQALSTHVVDEASIVAMYMNNRAVEALVKGAVDNAYAWARESIRRDPTFVSALNTLGVIYLRQGALAFAERVFSRLLASQPDNTRAIANLAEALMKQGRVAEAKALRERLAQLETAPPFHYFNLGVAAMRRDDYVTARGYFANEIARAEHNAEFHHWMAVASFKLDDHTTAARHLALAREYSTSRGDRDLYAAKLAWLKAQASH
jgi:Flp pilus assembly protein TadD